MILADKIIRLRKKHGLTQEELADKMNVSRQAVSKWESAQTIPDLEKILQLGQLFGVTTDYLLKDEIENEEYTDGVSEPGVRKMTLAEANEYLLLRKVASIRIAIATMLCIVSVFPLLLLGVASENPTFFLSEELACGIGVVAMFPIVAVAVAIFIRTGFASAPYEFIEKEPFETEYGVISFVKDAKKKYRSTYVRLNCIGTCVCILSPIPLLCAAFSDNDIFAVIMLTVTMLIAGIISGYKFSSIRFLSFIFFLENGKLKLKKLKLAGTGGQCLMIPPKLDGTSPVCLYNWGGCLANLIFSIIFLVVACFSKSFPTL